MPPVKPRFRTLEEAGANSLQQSQFNYLNRPGCGLDSCLFDSLGVMLDENKQAPVSNFYIPRIFVMSPNEEGRDFPQNINSTKFTPGTKEFYQQVQLGNVFVYPAGQADPVQLQLQVPESGAPSLSFSDPVKPEAIPMPPVKPLRGMAAFLNKISGGLLFRRRATAYKNAVAAHESTVRKLRQNAETRASVLEEERKQMEKEKRRAEYRKELKTVEAQMKMASVGKQRFVNTFGPVPKKEPELVKLPKSHALGFNYAFYRETDFRDLTILTDDEAGARQILEQKDEELRSHLKAQFDRKNKPYEDKDLDLNVDKKPYRFQSFRQKEIRPGGKPLTDAQFSAVALAAMWTPKLLDDAAKCNSKEYNPALMDHMKNAGIPEDKIELIAGITSRNMGTTDLFINTARDNEGIYFQPMAEPGRLAAAQALEAYRQNDKVPLAKLLAQGVNLAALDFNMQEGELIAQQTMGTLEMSKELLGLMEQDPSLKVAAEAQGMKRERLEVLQGMLRLYDLEQDGRRAEYELAKARVDDTELSAEQKKQYAKQIVLSRLAMGRLVSDCRAIAKDPNAPSQQFLKNGAVFIPDPVEGDNPVEKSKWGAYPPPKGKFYAGDRSRVEGGLRTVLDPAPKIATQMNDPKQVRELEELAEEIIRREKLDECSPDQLYRKLRVKNPELSISGCVQKVMEARKPAPELGQNAQPQARQNAQPELQPKKGPAEAGGPGLRAGG